MKKPYDLMSEAEEMDSQDFIQLVNHVDRLLSEEKEGSGELQITGRLVHVPPSGEATIIGDIHGDLDSLNHILADADLLGKDLDRKDSYLVFLGDYGDRGPYSPEVYYVILSLKSIFPENVVLLQGNHEGPEDLLASPHDLAHHLQRKFGADWQTVHRELSQLYKGFYTAALVEGRCIMLHGGVPSRAKDLEDIAYAYDRHPKEPHLEEILWSDPAEGIVGTYPSPRGAGNLFGEDVTSAFLKAFGIRFVVRGHEPFAEGYRISHGGKVLTLFSRKGSPYFNNHGAYLRIDLSSVFGSAWQLEPFIREF